MIDAVAGEARAHPVAGKADEELARLLAAHGDPLGERGLHRLG